MTRDELIHSIAETIRDYREGEIVVPSSLHVEKWVQQFPDEVQEPILAEWRRPQALDGMHHRIGFGERECLLDCPMMFTGLSAAWPTGLSETGQRIV